MKNFLPKSPIAAAGLGVLVGGAIAGVKMWSQFKNGEVSQKELVTEVVKQSALFGGVAAASTMAGGGKGGGAGIAALSVLGVGGGMGGKGGMLPNMLLGSITGGGGGRGGGGGGAGRGGGRGNGGADPISDAISDAVGGIISKATGGTEQAETGRGSRQGAQVRGPKGAGAGRGSMGRRAAQPVDLEPEPLQQPEGVIEPVQATPPLATESIEEPPTSEDTVPQPEAKPKTEK